MVIPMPPKPRSIMPQVAGSGTGVKLTLPVTAAVILPEPVKAKLYVELARRLMFDAARPVLFPTVKGVNMTKPSPGPVNEALVIVSPVVLVPTSMLAR